ncbi:MAG: amidohydrolase family protein [Pseudomonadales bacterium]|nr:amidohydrolase family protein [Pseudomonadales bacterium]
MAATQSQEESQEFDVHIKGGTIIDGARSPRYRGDLWIKDGIIAQIGGRPRGTAKKVIDADGLIVAPGFVDLHTHYDAQIHWDPWCTTSGWHGVTSVVLGNCGFGFAPVKPDMKDRSLLTMTRNEAIPFETMKAGMPFDWETIPEYLESLQKTPKGVNCLHYMPTGPLMIYVMGLEAAKTRAATEDERAEMARLLHEGMDVGLCGFSIQRLGPNSTQGDYDGTPQVTDIMVDEDIFNLARVLKERDEGFIQISQVTGNPKEDKAFIEKLAEVSGRPIIFNFVSTQKGNPDFHQKEMRWLKENNEAGRRIFGQSFTLRMGMAFSLNNWAFWDSSPAWKEALMGTGEERLAKLADPDIRQRIKQETDGAVETARKAQAGMSATIEGLIVHDVCGKENLEHLVGKTLIEVSGDQDKHVIDAMLDLVVAAGIDTEFLFPYLQDHLDPDFVAEMMTDSIYTIPGVSDGGAHTKFFNGGSYTTDFLMWLVRDEKKMCLEEAHYRLSGLPAQAGGFHDRGRLTEGAPADVIVYDLDRLDILPKLIGEVVHDFPGDEWRRVQRAEGYEAIFVNGVLTFEAGQATGATPGKLLRHGRG